MIYILKQAHFFFPEKQTDVLYKRFFGLLSRKILKLYVFADNIDVFVASARQIHNNDFIRI